MIATFLIIVAVLCLGALVAAAAAPRRSHKITPKPVEPVVHYELGFDKHPPMNWGPDREHVFTTKRGDRP